MRPRVNLHAILVGLLGSNNVYFQPPEGFKMLYPCIVYNINNIRPTFADNLVYSNHVRYTVTLIGHDPDSLIFEKLANHPFASFDRHFTNAGLNHNVFNVYY